MFKRVVLACSLCTATSAWGADWYTGAKQPAPGEDWVVAVDAAVDVTTQGSYFGDLQITAAPGGTLSTSGFRARVEGLTGRYQYFATDTNQTVHGTQDSGSALLGYQWISPNLSFMALLGADIRNNQLSIADPQNPVIGTNYGAKGQLELFATPTPTTMVSAAASFATNKTAYFTRLRYGYLIAPELYIGPEVLVLGDAFFNQERIGVHLTGLSAGPIRFAFAAGYLNDRVRGSGGYGTFSARVGF